MLCHFVDFNSYEELEASDALSGLELGRGPLNSDFESDSKVSDDGEESDASALNDAIELGKAAEGTTIHGNVFHNSRVFFSFCLSSYCQYMHALCRGLVAVKIVFCFEYSLEQNGNRTAFRVLCSKRISGCL